MSTYLSERQKWRYDFERAGKRYSGYCVNENGADCTTKRQADACEARVKAQVDAALKTKGAGRGAKIGVAVPGAYTVEQMFADFVSQKAGRNRSFPTNQKKYIAELMDFFGRQTAVASIDQDRISGYILFSQAQPKAVYCGGPKKGGAMVVREVKGKPKKFRSDSTTNRYLGCLRAAINWAAKAKKMPPIHVTRLDEPDDLPNPVALQLVNKILAVAEPHLRLAITIAVHTGMRLDETLLLRWDWINFESMTIKLPSARVKAKRGQVIYMNDDLATVLRETPQMCEEVVTYTRAKKPEALKKRPPRPIKSLKRAWHTAQKLAGVKKPYHRFHDLRATFCTAVLVANNNPIALKDAARHASLNTTMRYLKLADATVRTAFDATKGLFGKPHTKSPTQDNHNDGAATDGAPQDTENT